MIKNSEHHIFLDLSKKLSQISKYKAPDKALFFQSKLLIFFSFPHKNIYSGTHEKSTTTYFRGEISNKNSLKIILLMLLHHETSHPQTLCVCVFVCVCLCVYLFLIFSLYVHLSNPVFYSLVIAGVHLCVCVGGGGGGWCGG